jgi:hypothetical protein
MNWKKYALAFVVVLVLKTVLGFVIHGVLLNADYAQFPNLLRTQEDANAHFPYMLLNFVAFSLGFVWIYAHGLEEKPWFGQGIRFGLAVWLLASVSTFLTYYAVQPWPGALVGKQIGYELIEMLLLGIAAAVLYRK